MTNYEIEVEVGMTRMTNVMGCTFWFNNPLNDERTLIIKFRESGESNMEFIRKVKEYINSKGFINDLKAQMLTNFKKHNKENKFEEDYNIIKEEFDGMKLTVNVEIDK